MTNLKTAKKIIPIALIALLAFAIVGIVFNTAHKDVAFAETTSSDSVVDYKKVLQVYFEPIDPTNPNCYYYQMFIFNNEDFTGQIDAELFDYIWKTRNITRPQITKLYINGDFNIYPYAINGWENLQEIYFDDDSEYADTQYRDDVPTFIKGGWQWDAAIYNCKNLNKLYIDQLRTLGDYEDLAITNECRNLKQIELFSPDYDRSWCFDHLFSCVHDDCLVFSDVAIDNTFYRELGKFKEGDGNLYQKKYGYYPNRRSPIEKNVSLLTFDNEGKCDCSSTNLDALLKLHKIDKNKINSLNILLGRDGGSFDANAICDMPNCSYLSFNCNDYVNRCNLNEGCINNLPKLNTIELCTSRVNWHAFSNIETLTTVIMVEHNDIAEGGLSNIPHLQSITTPADQSPSNTNTFEGANSISNCPNLIVIDLYNIKILKEDAIKNNPQLKSIKCDISGTTSDDEYIKLISGCANGCVLNDDGYIYTYDSTLCEWHRNS